MPLLGQMFSPRGQIYIPWRSLAEHERVRRSDISPEVSPSIGSRRQTCEGRGRWALERNRGRDRRACETRYLPPMLYGATEVTSDVSNGEGGQRGPSMSRPIDTETKPVRLDENKDLFFNTLLRRDGGRRIFLRVIEIRPE